MNLEQTFGRYRLLEPLGEGGMAEVFKAKSFGVEGFEKILVIKRILPKLARQSKFVDMFVHEAKLAVRLSHANIVQVFDLGRVESSDDEALSYFIAMEYVAGLDLATLLLRCRRQKMQIPCGMAVFLAAEVAKALDHAHRRRDEQSRPLGIVHRDISPQNILLSWEGEVKVTDFGIAKAKDSILMDEEADTRSGRVRGKLAYMSPEQSKAQPLDGRSDLFSLGTVLYEMIAGNNPFAAPTAYETLRRVQASEYPPLELLRSDVPPMLVEIVNKLLAKQPEDRFPDAGRLYEHLLGYFYSSGERFGPSRLAEFLEQFREVPSIPEREPSAAFEEEPLPANERTPVEVPNPGGSQRATGSFRITGERSFTGHFTRTAEIGERREVTALVVSFIGVDRSTETSEAVRLVSGRAREILARYGAGILEQDLSQIVALFGLGDADGRDTEAAVRAALVILRASSNAVQISAGIAVARILVDAHGEPVKDERLTALIASAQTLSRATEGQVVVSSLAARIIRAEFTTEELAEGSPTIPDGGKIVTSAQAPSAAYGRFVGRHEELRRLGSILATATRRRVQLVTVAGDKGLGKTRLLAEMERRLVKGNYNVGFYVASCPRNGADKPWSGLSAMLRVLCGIQEGDDEARILEVLPRLRALGLHSDESTAVLAQLGATTSSILGKPPMEASAALRSGFSRMVQRLCDDRLHCFCWDDAQSIDDATLETVLSIVGRSQSSGDRSSIMPGDRISALPGDRISALPGDRLSTIPSIYPSFGPTSAGLRAVFLFATRNEPFEQIAEHPLHHSISLSELSNDDSARLISTRIGARVLAPELLSFCRDRAGGHPLFLEELIKELTDSGAISVANGEARARLERATTVPRTLRTLIAARVSRLDPAERAILQAAAILGEPILTSVLAALLKQAPEEIARAVANLVSCDFLRTSGPSQVSFASPIHGEIVLDAIPPEARRELHAAAAAAFVAAVGEDSIEHGERIAHHLYEAGARDRAATFFASVAVHKMKVGQLEPAIRLLCRAMDLADLAARDNGELMIWLNALADAVSHIRAAPDLAAVIARLIKRIDTAGTRDERVLARVEAARALGSVNLFDEAYVYIEDAFELAGDDAHLRSRALVVELESAVRCGDFARGLRAVEKLEAMGPMRSSRVLLAASFLRATSGDIASALRAIDEAGSLDRPDDLMAAFAREKQRVLVHIYSRDFKAAVDASARAVDLARSTGARFPIAAALHNLGDAARRLGDLPRAYAAFSESKEICESAGQERLATLNRIHLAYLDGLGEVEGAEELLHDFIVYADSRGFVTDALEGHFLLGALLKHKGAHEDARRELGDVLQKAEAFGNQLIAGDARDALAELPHG